MITHLKLTNFRKFKEFELNADADLIVIHGNNAQGKSTILEALYVITNGNSPWTSDNEELINYKINGQPRYFRIEAQKQIEGEEKTHLYYQDLSKKVFTIDSHKTTRPKFFQNSASTLFSPEQIEILMISPVKRRDFIDNIISKIDLEFEDINSKLHRTLRQRNAFIKKLSKKFYDTGVINTEDQQFLFWTKEFAKYSAMIMSKRFEAMEKLSSTSDEFKIIYKPSLKLNPFEDLAQIKDIAKIHFEELMGHAKRDIAIGHTTIGAHRDDWTIMTNKEIKRFGSRGEKRMAIGKLIFQAQELISQNLGFYPTLLLDDIPSELDSENTRIVLDKAILSKQQTFITTIDLRQVPQKVLKNALIIELN